MNIKSFLQNSFCQGKCVYKTIILPGSNSFNTPVYYSRSFSTLPPFSNGASIKNVEPRKELYTNKTLQAIFQQSEEHKKLQKKRTAEYEIGKRHLANMMGEDPETFTQEDVNRAISYLLPSGLYEPKARPTMKPPEEVFSAHRPLAFNTDGRPFNALYYTGKPNYYSVLQEISMKTEHLQNLLDKMKEKPEECRYGFDGSMWVGKDHFEGIILEKITDDLFEHFIRSMERMMQHPLAFKENEFIMRFRRQIKLPKQMELVPEVTYTKDNIPYVTLTARRKSANATVTVYGRGSGRVRINGDDILYFEDHQDRRQVMFPLQLTGVLSSVDVEGTVESGGPSSQAGAIKLAIAKSLMAFVPQLMVDKMRLAGLLTDDVRRKERQKPGKRGARESYKWKKR